MNLVILRRIILALLCIPAVSCLHSRTGAASPPARVRIAVSSGRAFLKIQGRVNEDLYYRVPFFGPAPKEAPSAGQPAVVAAGTLTVNEERILSAGEEWTYQVQPTEVVTVNIRALDGGELVFVVSRWGREEKRSLKASDPLGVTVAFQNR